MHNIDNKTKYRIEDCIITNNKNHITSLDGEKWEFSQSDLVYSEKNVLKEGDILLQKKIDDGLVFPRDYLHVIKGQLGDKLNAGVFIKDLN